MIWPLDSNDLERMDRNWATKEESPPRLVAGGRPGVACDARALKVSRPAGSRKRSNHSVAERGAVPGCVVQKMSARERTKEESCHRVTMTAPRGPIAKPAPVSVSDAVKLVQKDAHAPAKTIG
jgi:hypothetical protein